MFKNAPLPKSILAASIVTLGLLANHSEATPVTALVNNGGTPQLVTFDTATPGTVSTAVGVTGLGVGETLVGIDFRPVDFLLVGFAYNSTLGTGKVYTINTLTGAVTSINSNTLTLGTGLTRVTADFNPFANALRVVTNAATGNNLRVTAGGTGTLATDTDLNPANANIRATAYSRDQPGGGTSGATTLYEIDGTGASGSLDSQGSVDFFTGSGTSPNTGTLTNLFTLTGVIGSAVVGFDIVSTPGTQTTSPGIAYLATSAGSFSTLNLTSGASTGATTIGGVYTNITDIAVLPEPGTLALLGVAGLALASRRGRRRSARV